MFGTFQLNCESTNWKRQNKKKNRQKRHWVIQSTNSINNFLSPEKNCLRLNVKHWISIEFLPFLLFLPKRIDHPYILQKLFIVSLSSVNFIILALCTNSFVGSTLLFYLQFGFRHFKTKKSNIFNAKKSTSSVNWRYICWRLTFYRWCI